MQGVRDTKSKSRVPGRSKSVAARKSVSAKDIKVARGTRDHTHQVHAQGAQAEGTPPDGSGIRDLLEDFDRTIESGSPLSERGEVKEFQSSGNTAQAVIISRTPKTEQQILDECKIDTSIWRVERQKIKQWEVAMAPRAIGRTPDWRRDSANPIVVPLYGYQLWLVRIRPASVIFPEVQPIIFSVSARSLNRPVRLTSPGDIKTAVVLPDIQCGFKRDHRTAALEAFHDRQCMEVAWAITKKVRPDRIILLGDNLDLPEFSDKFVKSPEFYFTTQAAVAELAWWLTRLRSDNPHAQIDYIEGNHDRRFLLSIINHNVASYDLRPADEMTGPALMSVERLLGLAGLGINYHGPYPTGEVWVNNNLKCHHGHIVRVKSGQTMKVVVEDLRHSEIQGHIHRVEMASKTVWARSGAKVYVGFSPGTLANIRPGRVPAASFRNNWQNGLAVVEYEEGNGFFNTYPLHIYQDQCVYGGTKWVARSEDKIAQEIQLSLGDQVRVV